MVSGYANRSGRRWALLCLLGLGSGIESALLAQDVPPPVPPATAEEGDVVPAPEPVMTAPAPAPAAKPAAPKPPPQPWKPLFFDNDFSYKKDPNHTPLLGENFKEIPLDEIFPADVFSDTTVSFGGELRFRYMDERNRLRPLGNTKRNMYDLWRWRNYLDIKHSDWLRGYVEMIDASIFHNDLPPTGIDENRWDLQNYFVDIAPLELNDQKVWFRAGRQELLYGSQRLVSPLDWANTRRNFEGFKVFTKGEAWDIDAWVTNPVNTATPNDGPLSRFDNSFDSRNQDRVFTGAWATYKGVKDHTFDYYFLWDHTSQNNAGGPNLAAYPLGNRYLTATRWLGNYAYSGDGVLHGEVEGGYQFGNDHGRRVNAGFVTVGAGHTWKSLPWEPNLWFYYDWASGDGDPDAGGTNSTFFQYFGLVHAYLGLIDNIARQNISDVNWKFTVKPHKKVTFLTAQHFFSKANSNDYLYNVTGARIGAPDTGSDIGQELDLLLTYNHNQNFSVEAGYFWFWYGAVFDTMPRDTAQQFYLQTTFRY